MQNKVIFDWTHVTHVTPSQYSDTLTCVFFTSGKYTIVNEEFCVMAGEWAHAKERNFTFYEQ